MFTVALFSKGAIGASSSAVASASSTYSKLATYDIHQFMLENKKPGKKAITNIKMIALTQLNQEFNKSIVLTLFMNYPYKKTK